MKSENSAQIPPMKTVFLKGHGKFSSAWPKAELLLGKAEDVARGVDPVVIEIVKLQAWALTVLLLLLQKICNAGLHTSWCRFQITHLKGEPQIRSQMWECDPQGFNEGTQALFLFFFFFDNEHDVDDFEFVHVYFRELIDMSSVEMN